MNPYSLYIGPAGPFGIFPSSRLKRRPSHCELELAEGECGFVSARGQRLSHTFPQGEVTLTEQPTWAEHSPYTHAQNHSLIQSQPPNKPQRALAKSMPWGPQNDSSTQMHSHPGSSHRTTTMQETAMGPQPHRRQSHNHSHLGPLPHKSQPHNRSHV